MTIDERQRLWVTVYALNAFDRASGILRLLFSQCADTSDPLYLPLTVALHALYSRPFNQIDGIERTHLFSKKDVPVALRDVHEFMISFRNKVFVHTDSDTSKMFGMRIHEVHVEVTANDVIYSSSDPRPQVDTYRRVVDLVDAMTREVSQRLVSLKRVLDVDLPKELGVYRLRLNADPVFGKV